MARITKPKLDLNIWINNYVAVTLSGHGHEEETDGGVVVVPRIIKGLFVQFDGSHIHMNDINLTPGPISISIRAELVDFVTLANPEGPDYPENDSVN